MNYSTVFSAKVEKGTCPIVVPVFEYLSGFKVPKPKILNNYDLNENIFRFINVFDGQVTSSVTETDDGVAISSQTSFRIDSEDIISWVGFVKEHGCSVDMMEFETEISPVKAFL